MFNESVISLLLPMLTALITIIVGIVSIAYNLPMSSKKINKLDKGSTTTTFIKHYT